MVFTLHRYIFREIFRVFILATLALTLMMSLGMILRPVQEYGVGPSQVVHLMGYFIPIILTYVLPIAALFAGAFVYGRFASDNELDACKASGISLLTTIYPGIALAIMVTIANLILSFHVIPAFVKRAEKSYKADAQKIIFRNIQRKGYFKPSDGKYLIYADNADMENEMLTGVVITEQEGSKIEKIISAETAKVQFNSNRRFNEIQVTAHNTYQMSSENMWYLGLSSFSEQFPAMLGDDISFKKIDEMKEIEADPMRFTPIAKEAYKVFAQLTVDLLVKDISAKFSEYPNNYYTLYSGQKFVEITAASCNAVGKKKKVQKVQLSGEAVIFEYDTNRKIQRILKCRKALLHLEGDELTPTLTLQIDNPRVIKKDGSEGLAGRQFIRGLIVPQNVREETNKFATEDSLNAKKLAEQTLSHYQAEGSRLNSMQDILNIEIKKTLVDIKAEVHSRLAFGIGCIPLISIGICLGIIKKGGHLLSAFGVSFLPATVLVVFILMGKNIVKNPGSKAVSGIILIWAVVVFLVLLAVEIHRRLLKN